MNDRKRLVTLVALAVFTVVFLSIRLGRAPARVPQAGGSTAERIAPDPLDQPPPQNQPARPPVTVTQPPMTQPPVTQPPVAVALPAEPEHQRKPPEKLDSSERRVVGGSVTANGVDWMVLEGLKSIKDVELPSGYEIPSPDELQEFRKDAVVRRRFPFLFDRAAWVWSNETLPIAGRRKLVDMTSGAVESRDEEVAAYLVLKKIS